MDHDYMNAYYFPFKTLRYLGQWSYESDSGFKKILYFVYRAFTFMFGWHVVTCGFLDLYVNWNDSRKVIFNSCTTAFTLGVTVKNIYILGNSERIENLRIQLLQDALVQRDEEDIEILKRFQKTLKITEVVFLITFALFYPSWIFSSLTTLKKGPRELPFPVWLPVDLEDDLQFALGFMYHAFAGTFMLAEAAWADLAMYSLLLQITGQYVILKKNVLKVNDLCCVEKRKEKNKYLLRIILKEKFKQFVQRQLELKRYVIEIEGSYNQVMLLQFLGGLIIAIGNGLELIVVMNTFSLKLFYQFAFFLIIVSDVFICCALADSLIDESKDINKALYSLAWYEMGIENMKDILLMTTGTQKLPSLTAGKLFPLNLKLYLRFIRNLYSWLALFRQIVMMK